MNTLARVRLFGEFRSWVRDGEIQIDLGDLQTVADLKTRLIRELKKRDPREGLESLMAVSAVAENTRILLETEKLADLHGATFALLPPVSGG